MRRLLYSLENALAIAALVAKRLRHHLGLSLSSLVGIISVLSLVICVPVFTNAVLSQVLKQSLIEKSLSNHRSLFSLHVYYVDDSTNTSLSAQGAGSGTVAAWYCSLLMRWKASSFRRTRGRSGGRWRCSRPSRSRPDECSTARS